MATSNTWAVFLLAIFTNKYNLTNESRWKASHVPQEAQDTRPLWWGQGLGLIVPHSHFNCMWQCVDQASHNMSVMDLEDFSCPHNHSPGVIYDFSEVLRVMVNAIKIALEEEWLLGKKVNYRWSNWANNSFWNTRKEMVLDLDTVKFYFYLNF